MRKVKIIFFGAIIGVIIAGLTAIMLPYRVSSILSSSMEPTLMTGEKVIIRVTREVQHGDVVAFLRDIGTGGKEFLVKRIAGIPGDYIESDGVLVYRNGEIIGESDKLFSHTVPEDCYFMLGDNAAQSQDSRYWIADPWARNEDIVGIVIRKIDGWQEVK